MIIVDTGLLVEAYTDQITLCRINSGFARFGQGKRNFATFKRIEDYPLGTKKNTPKELAVDYGIPDIAEFAISVQRWKGNELLKVIWER